MANLREFTSGGRRTAELDGPVVGLGSPIPEGATGTEMLEAIGANWTVEKQPAHLADGTRIPNTFAVCRKDPDGVVTPFGNGRCVGAGFNTYQNHELAAFAETLGMRFEAGGTLNGGTAVWLSARMPESAVTIRTTKLGEDKVEPALFLMTAHNGTSSTIGQQSSTRLFCLNQIPGILKDRGTMRVPHTRNQRVRLEAAQKMIARSLGLFDEHVAEMRKLDAIDMNLAQMKAFAEELLGATEESIAEADRSISATKQRNRIELRDRAVDLMRGGLGNIGKSAFDAYQGVVELVDHHFERGSDAARFRALLSDQGERDIKRRARAMLLR